MSRLVVVFAVLVSISLSIASAAAFDEPADTKVVQDENSWSQESNGLRARLSMRLSHVKNGTGIVHIYLELENVGDLGTPLLVTVDQQNMTFRVTDGEGGDVRMSGGVFSGRDFGSPELVLPHDSAVRFRIGPCCRGIPADHAALVDLGTRFGWVLPRDDKQYYLQAVLAIAREKNDRSERGILWHGQLDLPRVVIPTRPDPVDSAKLGQLIDDFGAKMLAQDARASEAAVRRLSLIDDPRVVPWYVNAMKTDSYSLKFNALDRLSRLKGDAALEGLQIGMTTQGEDIGNCTTSAVAAASAENIRHAAASGLARSPHSQAKTLLLSMHDDPAIAVRVTVIQAAARMETAESMAILERHTRDADVIVREEATRLLKLRKNSSMK